MKISSHPLVLIALLGTTTGIAVASPAQNFSPVNSVGSARSVDSGSPTQLVSTGGEVELTPGEIRGITRFCKDSCSAEADGYDMNLAQRALFMTRCVASCMKSQLEDGVHSESPAFNNNAQPVREIFSLEIS